MRFLIQLIFRRLIHSGRLRIIPAQGAAMEFGDASAKPIIITFTDYFLPLKIALNSVLAIGEAYMDGRLKIVNSDLYSFMDLLARNYAKTPRALPEQIMRFFSPLLRTLQQHNSRQKARQNVAHHYDLSNEFYRLFLDHDMQYSCAYFEYLNQDLEAAQFLKKRHIAQKMLLRPGMRVLDIGCGWGGMAIYLAREYNVEVVGLTLSTEQHRLATERARQAGVADKVTFRLCDYRDEKEQFDRIVSVGMFEHVGTGYYPDFFAQVRRLLKPDGVMLLHSIGRMDEPGTTNSWTRKYIFPGGYIPALSEVTPVIEQENLLLTDMEILRLHYAETLRHWRRRCEVNRRAIVQMYDEKFFRMWEFYLVTSEVSFRHLKLMVFQMQLTRELTAAPLTRDYMLNSIPAAAIKSAKNPLALPLPARL